MSGDILCRNVNARHTKSAQFWWLRTFMVTLRVILMSTVQPYIVCSHFPTSGPLQTRFPILISIGASTFEKGFGPADLAASWGRPLRSIGVRNGVLGLSHGCIHAQSVSDVVIENVWARDFDAHGIQFNQFQNMAGYPTAV